MFIRKIFSCSSCSREHVACNRATETVLHTTGVPSESSLHSACSTLESSWLEEPVDAGLGLCCVLFFSPGSISGGEKVEELHQLFNLTAGQTPQVVAERREKGPPLCPLISAKSQDLCREAGHVYFALHASNSS